MPVRQTKKDNPQGVLSRFATKIVAPALANVRSSPLLPLIPGFVKHHVQTDYAMMWIVYAPGNGGANFHPRGGIQPGWAAAAAGYRRVSFLSFHAIFVLTCNTLVTRYKAILMSRMHRKGGIFDSITFCLSTETTFSLKDLLRYGLRPHRILQNSFCNSNAAYIKIYHVGED